jgi:hypothetical protein
LYVLIFSFLDMKREDKIFRTEWQQVPPEFKLLLISSWIPFSFVSVFPKYLNFATSSNDSLIIFIVWFSPEFWWRYIIIYFVFSAFISRPTSLLPSRRVSVLF